MNYTLLSDVMAAEKLIRAEHREQSRMAWELIRNGWKIDFDANEFRPLGRWFWFESPAMGGRRIKYTRRAWIMMTWAQSRWSGVERPQFS